MVPYLLFCILCAILFVIGMGWYAAGLWAIVTAGCIMFPVLRELFYLLKSLLDWIAEKMASDKEA